MIKIHISIHLTIYLSIYQSIYLSIYQSIYLSFYLFIYLDIGDHCDEDIDGDGIDNEEDSCPLVQAKAQVSSFWNISALHLILILSKSKRVFFCFILQRILQNCIKVSLKHS